jgi:hypothetical protein
MPTYQQLDVIADSYIPALFIITVLMLARDIFKFGLKSNLIQLSSVILSIVIVYSVMAIDNHFKIWPALDLDYSTHTALSLVFVMYLSSQSKVLLALSTTSFLFYILLMIYQKYHTTADIVSTAVILIPIFWLLFYCKVPIKPANKQLKRTP